MASDGDGCPEVDGEEISASRDGEGLEFARETIAGVVNDDVDAVEARQGGGEGGGDGGFGGEVDGDKEGVF